MGKAFKKRSLLFADYNLNRDSLESKLPAISSVYCGVYFFNYLHHGTLKEIMDTSVGLHGII